MSRPFALRSAPALCLAPLTLALASAALLTACGGGGEDAGTALVAAGTEPRAVAAATVAAPYSLSLSSTRVALLPGQSVTVTATLARQAGFGAAVQVALRDLPAGVTAAAVTIPANQTTAPLVLRAGATAAPSLPTAATAKALYDTQVATAPLTVTVRGRPGSLDPSFGGGVVVTPVGTSEDYAAAAAVQRDAKVLVAGSSIQAGRGTDFALVRYLRDGTPDKSFGNQGVVVTPIGAGTASDQATAVAVQADGKIVVAGVSDGGATREDFALVRYNADGSLDPGFGQGGKVTTAFLADSSDRINAMVIQPDGKIVVGGFTYSGATTNIDFALARYNPDGRLDTSFGHGGKLVTAAAQGTRHDSINALALQEIDGETCIVAAGGEGDFFIARYHADGALDKRFGGAGIVTGLFPSATIGAARGVLAEPGGKIVVTGHILHDFTTVRLLQNGQPDTSFGQQGKVITAVSATNWDEATGIVRQSNGAYVVGGWVYKGGSSAAQFAALRYTAAGVLDPAFGQQGISIAPVSQDNRSASGRAIVLQTDSRIPGVRAILAGDRSQSNYDFAVIRLWL